MGVEEPKKGLSSGEFVNAGPFQTSGSCAGTCGKLPRVKMTLLSASVAPQTINTAVPLALKTRKLAIDKTSCTEI
jgi:hypothetical protein